MGTMPDGQTLHEKFDGIPGMPPAIDALVDLTTALDEVAEPEPPPEPAEGEPPPPEPPSFSWVGRDNLRGLLVYLETALAGIDSLLISQAWADKMTEVVNAAATVVRSTNGQVNPPDYTTLTDFVREALVVGQTQAIRETLVLATERVEGTAERMQQKADELEARKNELETKANETAGHFEAVVTNGEAALQEQLNAFEAAHEQVAREGREQYEADRVEQAKAGKDATEEADNVLAELRRTLSLAADVSLSAGYGNQADAEATTADDLRKKAVRYGLATAVAAALALGIQVVLALAGESGANWSLLPVKAAFIATLAAIAAYYGRQSSQHRSYSQQLRNAQLELNNIGPYLAELDEDERGEVKRELVHTFFGKPVETVDDDSPTTTATTEQFLEFARLLLGSKK